MDKKPDATWWDELANKESHYVPETGHTITTYDLPPCPNDWADDCRCEVCDSVRELEKLLRGGA